MISLYRMYPNSTADAERYLALVDRSRNNPEVVEYLPEIFDDTTTDQVLESLKVVTRYLVLVNGQIVGRVDNSTSLNEDPSVVDKVPEGINLGLNVCYFINPEGLDRNLEAAHIEVARMSIETAFAAQEDETVSPWLPVAPENDPSRGWLMQTTDTFTVHREAPRTGWLPQYGVQDIEFGLSYATRD